MSTNRDLRSDIGRYVKFLTLLAEARDAASPAHTEIVSYLRTHLPTVPRRRQRPPQRSTEDSKTASLGDPHNPFSPDRLTPLLTLVAPTTPDDPGLFLPTVRPLPLSSLPPASTADGNPSSQPRRRRRVPTLVFAAGWVPFLRLGGGIISPKSQLRLERWKRRAAEKKAILAQLRAGLLSANQIAEIRGSKGPLQHKMRVRTRPPRLRRAQPESLNRAIRFTIKRRQERLDLVRWCEGEGHEMAREEDEWEAVLTQRLGVPDEDASSKGQTAAQDDYGDDVWQDEAAETQQDSDLDSISGASFGAAGDGLDSLGIFQPVATTSKSTTSAASRQRRTRYANEVETTHGSRRTTPPPPPGTYAHSIRIARRHLLTLLADEMRSLRARARALRLLVEEERALAKREEAASAAELQAKHAS